VHEPCQCQAIGPTEAGERFHSRAKPAFEELVAASEVARDLGTRPAGLLRLSAPRAVVPLILEPVIASFCQAYPEIEVEIAASRRDGGSYGGPLRRRYPSRRVHLAVRLTQPFPL
jgi:DNA-binding transcriptional LysR family regulator